MMMEPEIIRHGLDGAECPDCGSKKLTCREYGFEDRNMNIGPPNWIFTCDECYCRFKYVDNPKPKRKEARGTRGHGGRGIAENIATTRWGGSGPDCPSEPGGAGLPASYYK